MKHFFKYIIYFLSFYFSSNKKSKVIYYHDITNQYTDMGTDFSLFREHIKIIREEGYSIVPEINNDVNQIMICFDDGWAGIYDSKDFFYNNNIQPTVFLAIDLIGKDGYLTLNQIKELKDIGFLFESHTWSHFNLSTYNAKELKRELLDSKNELSQILNQEISSLCFPQGYFSKKVIELSIEYGYKKLYSSIPGAYSDLVDSHNVICRNLVQFVSPRLFKLIINTTPEFFKKRSYRRHYK